MAGKEKVVLPDDLRCNRTDGRRWRCKRKVLDGNKLCEYHFQKRYNRQFKRGVPISLKPEHKINDHNKKNSLGINSSKYVKIAKKRTKGKLKDDDLIRVFLKRCVENKKKKIEKGNLSETQQLEMPDTAMAIEKPHTQIPGIGIEGSSNVFSRKKFLCKNIETKPINTMLQEFTNEKKKAQKIQLLQYLIYKLRPILSQINKEQQIELRKEVKKKSLHYEFSEFSVQDFVSTIIKQIQIQHSETKCSNCKISILDYHRICANCSYTLCLNCYRSKTCGCGKTLLELKCIYPLCWIIDLETSAEEILRNYNFRKFFDDPSCLICNEVCTIRNLGEESLEHFQKHWRKGEPVIIQNLLQKTSPLKWDPIFMFCAYLERCNEYNNKLANGTNCLDWFEVKFATKRRMIGSLETQTVMSTQFETIKINALISSALFKEYFPAHFSKSLRTLPFQEYINPFSSLLNLEEMLSPRIDISYDEPEAETLINLRYDPCDQVNILAYATNALISEHQLKRIKKLVKKRKVKGFENKEGSDESHDSQYESGFDSSRSFHGSEKETEDSCGAQWDMFNREDVSKLKEYFTRHSNEFISEYGYSKQIVHPILDQSFFLDTFHKLRLKEEFGVEPWTINQFPGEAVIVPAGSPYQIKKLKSCVNIVVDFISPENASECIKLNEEIRVLPMHHKAREKMFEVKKMALFSVSSAIEAIRDLTQTKIMNVLKEELSVLKQRDQDDVVMVYK